MPHMGCKNQTTDIYGAHHHAPKMSHQQAKSEAIRIIKELLMKHPPGMVIMILRELKTLLRATRDITTYKE